MLLLVSFWFAFHFNLISVFFFFSNDPATTEIYTLSLHTLFRSLFISCCATEGTRQARTSRRLTWRNWPECQRDRKSTRLNSSHPSISYAVFCLKKKTANRVLSN